MHIGAQKIEASPVGSLLAVCGKSGLIVWDVTNAEKTKPLIQMDEAECIDIQWSPRATFFSCIRREGIPETSQAYLMRMHPNGPILDYRDFSKSMPLACQKLKDSSEANLLSFSPNEKWLVVGRKPVENGPNALLSLYNL